ncbi:MAG: sulfur carrier protein ThiS [Verrucomicrobia bacterium]|nr:sulfur carrier protein ThiS [Verrucomicrobiota bacterium]
MTEAPATIMLNGKSRKIKQPCSATELLSELGWKPTQVVIEHNGQVIPRSETGAIMLREGDQVEIILPVAGG